MYTRAAPLAQQIADIDLFYRSRVRQMKISSLLKLIALINGSEWRHLHFKVARVCGKIKRER